LWREDQYVKFDRDICVGCFACVESCPYNGIWTHPDLDYPLKCNLCDGTPLCVETCPAKVLKLVETEETAEQVRNEFIPGQALVQAYKESGRDKSE
jgi:Fe-S-cluster-containing dehydrogenase component